MSIDVAAISEEIEESRITESIHLIKFFEDIEDLAKSFRTERLVFVLFDVGDSVKSEISALSESAVKALRWMEVNSFVKVGRKECQVQMIVQHHKGCKFTLLEGDNVPTLRSGLEKICSGEGSWLDFDHF